MNFTNRFFGFTGERLSAVLLAAAVTVMVLAAVNAGFTPHAAGLAGHTLGSTPFGL